MPAARSTPTTSQRIVATAVDAFGTRGVDATSLDDLAGRLGLTKQAILYWFPSKDAVVQAAVDWSAVEIATRFQRALRTDAVGFERIESIVRAGFRLAARHPALIGFMREINRIGPPNSVRMTAAVAELLEAAAAWLEAEMDAGRLRRHDPKLLVLLAYSAVTGLASETEVLRALGDEPTLASLIRRRDALLDVLRVALEP